MEGSQRKKQKDDLKQKQKQKREEEVHRKEEDLRAVYNELKKACQLVPLWQMVQI